MRRHSIIVTALIVTLITTVALFWSFLSVGLWFFSIIPGPPIQHWTDVRDILFYAVMGVLSFGASFAVWPVGAAAGIILLNEL